MRAVMSMLIASLLSAQAVFAQTKQEHAVPDLNGYWNGQGEFGLGQLARDPNKPEITIPLRNGDLSNLTNDGVIARRSGNNLPAYKSQYWDQVLKLDWNGNKEDPYTTCTPPGVARHARLVQNGAPRHVAGIDRLCLRQELRAHGGTDAVGTDQQIAALPHAVFKYRRDAAGVLFDPA